MVSYKFSASDTTLLTYPRSLRKASPEHVGDESSMRSSAVRGIVPSSGLVVVGA